jgi:alpha-tubulin suppressor-like RCC1 family protein
MSARSLRKYAITSVVAGLAVAMVVLVAPHRPDAADPPRRLVAVTSDHIGVVAWGGNSLGQLGDGTRTERHSSVPVSGLTDGIVQVAASGDHALALRSDGKVFAWGDNTRGQLGNGTTVSSDVPVQVFGGLAGVVAVAAGFDFSLALLSDHTVWAWGDDRLGQLGNSDASPMSAYPVLVSGLTDAAQISAGRYSALARRSNGTVVAWGTNSQGQIGDGQIANVRLTPFPIPGLTNVVQVVATGESAYARTATGQVWQWGEVLVPSQPPGMYANGAVVSARPVLGLPAAADIAAGSDYLLVAAGDGTVWSWGPLIVGPTWGTSYGPGSTPPPPPAEPAPVPVAGLTHPIRMATTGETNYAEVPGGTVWAWGDNSAGQIGDGSTTYRSSPTQLPSLTGATSLVAGTSSAYAVIALPAPPPDFALAVSATSATVNAGGVATAIAGITATDPTSPVTFGASGQPPNTTISFSRPTITGSGLSLLSIHTTPATPVGTYPITIRATGPAAGPIPAIVHTVQLTLTVATGSRPGCVAASFAHTAIPDNSTPLDRRLSITGCTQRRGLATIEVIATHPKRGDLVVDITTPDGVIHHVKNANPADATRNLDDIYTFPMSSLGTGPVTFTVEITDIYPGNAGTLNVIYAGI